MPLHTTFSRLASVATQCHILLVEAVTKAHLGSKVGDQTPPLSGISRSSRETSMKDGTCTGAAASGMQRKEGQEMSRRKIHWALGPLVCMEGNTAEEGPESATKHCMEGWWCQIAFVQAPEAPPLHVVMVMPTGHVGKGEGSHHVTLTGESVGFLECQRPCL